MQQNGKRGGGGERGGGGGGKFLEAHVLFIPFKPRERIAAKDSARKNTNKIKRNISLCFPFLRAEFPVLICHRKWHLLLMGLP